MIGKYISVAILLAAASPAAAAQTNGAEDEDDQFGAWLSIEVAPAIVSDGPFRADSPTTDSTDVSWTLEQVQPLGEKLAFELEAGPIVTVDSDDDAEEESALAASLKIRSREPIAGFTPFVGYGIQFGYSDFFDGEPGTEHTIQAGVGFKGEARRWEFEVEIAPTLVESSEDPPGAEPADYVAVPLSTSVTYQLAPERANLELEASVERRWYSDLDPALLAERRDWRFQSYLGVDFAGEINRLIARDSPGMQPVFDEIGVGVRWLEVGSNVDAQDQSDVNVLPVVRIKVGI